MAEGEKPDAEIAAAEPVPAKPAPPAPVNPKADVPGSPNAGRSTGQTIRPEAQAAMRVAIWLLFAVYCSPLLVGAYAYLSTGGFNVDNPTRAIEFFIAFAATGEQSLSLVHRSLLPLMAGLAPIAFADEASTKSSTGLMVLIVFGIAASIWMGAVFGASTVKAALDTLAVFPRAAAGGSQAATNEASHLLIASFFSRTQETLGMYLLMLFGLTLAKK